MVLDQFSCSLHLLPLAALLSAFEVVKFLFNDVFQYYGIPEDVVSDRASQVWSSFMEKLEVNVSLISGFHPQANGQVERVNPGVGRFLHSFCMENQAHWSRFIPWEEYAQNSLHHSATNLTPFQCVLGYQLATFPWNTTITNSPAVDDWFKCNEEAWEYDPATNSLPVTLVHTKSQGR